MFIEFSQEMVNLWCGFLCPILKKRSTKVFARAGISISQSCVLLSDTTLAFKTWEDEVSFWSTETTEGHMNLTL